MGELQCVLRHALIPNGRAGQQKWNESGFRPPLCIYRLNWARRTSWGAPAVWGGARYLSVTEAPRNTDFNTWMGKKHFCFFQTAETGNRTPNSGVKGSGANHYPTAPAQLVSRESVFSTSTRRRINVGLMLAQRRGRWANIKPTLVQRYIKIYGSRYRICWVTTYDNNYLRQAFLRKSRALFRFHVSVSLPLCAEHDIIWQSVSRRISHLYH